MNVFIKPDGEDKWFGVESSEIIFDDNGLPRGVLINGSDIVVSGQIMHAPTPSITMSIENNDDGTQTRTFITKPVRVIESFDVGKPIYLVDGQE